MTIKVSKQLATMQDLAIGVGQVVQRRNGIDLTLDKIDLATNTEVQDRVIRVTSIAAMEAYSAPVGYVFSLNAGGRSGTFDVIDGNFFDELGADTLNGIYVGLSDDPTATTKVLKRRFQGAVSASWFGALGNGVANDTPNIQAAFDSGAKKVALFGGSVGFLLDTTLTVPAGSSLEGSYRFIDPRSAVVFESVIYADKVILNSSATILLQDSASIFGLLILRKGMVLPADANEVALFSGTAITIAYDSHGPFVGNSAIIGFNVAILTDNSSNTEQFRAEYLNIDCTNGLRIQNSFDIVYIENVHCWPSASVGLASPSDADLQRSGIAFLFQNNGDWNKLTNCFSLGYSRGVVIDSCNSVQVLNCGADYTASRTVTTMGFEVTGTSSEASFIACQAASQSIGFLLNPSTAAYKTAQMVGCSSWSSELSHVRVVSGALHINGGRFRGKDLSSEYGVDVQSGPVLVSGVSFENLDFAFFNRNENNKVIYDSTCVFKSVVNIQTNPFVASVASSDPLPLPLSGQDMLVNVTGTTSFGTILNANSYHGKTIVLRFTGGLTVLDGNLKLNGDFITSVNSTLTLAASGSVFYEVARSVN